MDKQVHDPTGNVDRPPERNEREGSHELERDAKRDRKVEQQVDQTIEQSFPASDPPSWNVGTSVIVEEEQERASAPDRIPGDQRDGDGTPASGSRAGERGNARRRMSTRTRPRTDDEDTLDMSRGDGADTRSPTRPARKAHKQRARQDQAPHTDDRQTRTHLAPEHTDERTDLPGRRNTTEGPHQAFPGAPKVSPPKPISH